MKEEKTQIFESAPVKKAVFSQIIPAILSQMIILVYNLADTYFVGLLNAPEQTAAVTVAYPVFLMLTAISNLFGVGGAACISRALGKKQPEKAKEISAISFWLGLAAGVAFSLIVFALRRPILELCGAKEETFAASLEYLKWVVIIGGPLTVLNTLLSNLVRSEGSSIIASIGVSVGGILNIILDPFFVLERFLNFKAAGAGMATMISNGAAVLFLLCYIVIRRKKTALSVSPKLLGAIKEHLRSIISIGLPSCLQYALTVVAVAAQSRFVSDHGITEAVAALGIVKKLDQLPLYFSIGVSNGLLPLLAYNHSAGNEVRRKKCFALGAGISLGFSVLCLVVYEIFAPALVGLFIDHALTIEYGTTFLRIMVTAMPMMSICYPMIVQFQAMKKTKESLVCSVLRKGVLDIPLLFLLDALWPLYGCMLVQPIVDTVSLLAVIAITIFESRRAQKNAKQKR